MSKKVKNYRQSTSQPTEQVQDLGAAKQVIPVLIYGEKWEIPITESAMKELISKVTSMEKELKDLQGQVSDEDFDQLAEILPRTFNSVLGDGAYTRIAKHESDPVTLIQTLTNLGNYLSDKFTQLDKKFEKQQMQQVISAKKNSQVTSPTLSPRLSAY